MSYLFSNPQSSQPSTRIQQGSIPCLLSKQLNQQMHEFAMLLRPIWAGHQGIMCLPFHRLFVLKKSQAVGSLCLAFAVSGSLGDRAVLRTVWLSCVWFPLGFPLPHPSDRLVQAQNPHR